MRSLPRVIKASQVRLREITAHRQPSHPESAPQTAPGPESYAGSGAARSPQAAPGAPGRGEERTRAREDDLYCAEQARDELLSLAREQSSELLKEARQEALNVGRQAEAEAAALRERAEREAYQLGLERAAREVEELLQRTQGEIDQTMAEARSQSEATIDGLEPRIFKLALEVAEKILGYELDHNNSAFMSMLKQALQNVKSENRVTLMVNPSEYVRFFKSREVTLHTGSGALKAEVVSDPTVGYGGCLIETESGAIDAGVNAQLKQIGKNLGLEGD